ncbi:MAG TPA: hypothetical protein VJ850_08455 [Candidatus Limnocylindrales bacterium]|nr:hypothetical protein [Candidatus Limnocylindrales bacterium]
MANGRAHPCGGACLRSERIRFQTETGSIYELSRSAAGAMAWRRLSATLASGDLRSDRGTLVDWPEVVVGGRCFLLSEPINPPFPRLVSTSFVVAILDRAGRVLPVSGAGARRTFRSLHKGDRVTRVAAGRPMGEFTVSSVDEQLVHCGPWAFDRVTGIEVDPELGWGRDGLVGTWLVHPADQDDV